MEIKKRLISVGDVFFIIGKYSFDPMEKPKVIEVQVAYKLHGRFFAYPTNGSGVFDFNRRDLGKAVFSNKEEAEQVLGGF